MATRRTVSGSKRTSTTDNFNRGVSKSAGKTRRVGIKATRRTTGASARTSGMRRRSTH